ncbi:hypothetical protein ACGCE5_14820 [Kluyvera ascorbata]|uniref:hypothetical protein n=1 Tax=Kluyvera ascorbata TaxID=51288 RepID=UPI00374CE26E
MKERGMIFNAEMVRAILDGRKTQTRRVMAIQPEHSGLGLRRVIDSKNGKDNDKYFWAQSDACGLKARSKPFACPHGSIGDRIWVRETWSQLGNEDGCAIDWNDELVKGGGPEAARIYRASCEQRPGNYGLWSIPDDAFWKPHTDNMEFEGAWCPSIHMPRWASRILLEITDVRVERLNDISEDDAKAEGAPTECCVIGDKHFLGFRSLWKSIYGDESWRANPWVWVIEFKRVEGGAA